jgi:hypothetical protein
MSSDFNILADAADDDSLDNHRNAPRPDPACLYGWWDVAARAATPPKPIPMQWRQTLSPSWAAPWAVGHTCIGNTWHHARMFMLHIGRSGRGRKGDAVS